MSQQQILKLAYRGGAALLIGGATGWVVQYSMPSEDWDGSVFGLELNLGAAAAVSVVAFFALPRVAPAAFAARTLTYEQLGEAGKQTVIGTINDFTKGVIGEKRISSAIDNFIG